MNTKMIAAAAALLSPCAAFAQADIPTQVTAGAETAGPVVAAARRAVPQHFLPANTEINMSLNQELSSKRSEEGDKFGLTVSHDVVLGDFVVIPKGTPAYGEVVWKTGRAVFGKSGKMEIELRYLDLSGRRIPLTGKYRQEGEGTTLAAVGAVVLAAPLMVITGKSARIPAGRELKAFTQEALPVSLPDGASADVVPIAASAPTPVVAATPSEPAAPAPATAATATANN